MAKSPSSVPQSVWEGTFTVFGVELKCFVLDNGQHVIEAESMASLFAAMENGSNCEPGDLLDFVRWEKLTTPEGEG